MTLTSSEAEFKEKIMKGNQDGRTVETSICLNRVWNFSSRLCRLLLLGPGLGLWIDQVHAY